MILTALLFKRKLRQSDQLKSQMEMISLDSDRHVTARYITLRKSNNLSRILEDVTGDVIMNA